MSRVVIIGLARTGVAVARALAAEGDRIRVVDSGDTEQLRQRAASLPDGVDVQLGGYAEDVARGADLVCPSPGVRWDAPELSWARAHGIAVRSEMDLVFERCRSRIVGITGTNGKTTTTALVAAILERGSNRVLLGGNIGTPVIDRLAGLAERDWVVLELSSFQLETVPEPRCSIACVLNVTPDHLDRHGTFEVYAGIKERVVRHATDCVVVGYDDPATRAMARTSPAPVRFFGTDIGVHDGTTLRDAEIVSVEAGGVVPVMPVAGIPLFGEHNVLNVMAAVACARGADIAAPEIAGAVRAFRAVPHRLEVVLEHGGVLWVNDSKATNTESAVVALGAFGGRSVVWIGGGKESALPADELAAEVAARARVAILTGDSAPHLDAALARRGFAARHHAASLADAVGIAHGMARRGDVVLLSPGYKSFDRFRDFEHRGDVFRDLVRALHAAPARPA